MACATLMKDLGEDWAFAPVAGNTGGLPWSWTAPLGGNFDFVPVLRADQSRNDLSWYISDHYPLFCVEFAIPAVPATT